LAYEALFLIEIEKARVVTVIGALEKLLEPSVHHWAVQQGLGVALLNVHVPAARLE
jgi:hypothetical protein